MAGSKQRLATRLAGPKWPWRPPNHPVFGPASYIGTSPQGIDVWIRKTGALHFWYWTIFKRDAHVTTTAASSSTATMFLEPFADEIAQAIEDDAKARERQEQHKQGAPQRRRQQQKPTRSSHHG